MTLTRNEFLRIGGGAMLGATTGPSFFRFLNEPRGFGRDVLETPQIERIHQYIEEHRDEHVAKVQRDLRQPSVSSWNMGMSEMAELMRVSYEELGCREAELVPTDGYPGVWGWYDAGAEKTISTYMMYDIQPWDETEWSSPPLAANLVEMDPFGQVIIARGAINDKGPNRMFLNACEAIIAIEGKLPVNIMFTCEGEEEQGSTHLDQILAPHYDQLKACGAHVRATPPQDRDGFITMHLGRKGIAYVELECHGRLWGRGPQERAVLSGHKAVLDSPVWRLVKALSSMVDETGNRVLIDGFYDSVAPPTDEERMLVETIISKYGEQALARDRGNVKAYLNDWTVADVVRHLMFDPSLNINGIFGGYTGPGTATNLPEKATARLDARLVPNQKVAEHVQLMRDHLERRGYGDIRLTEVPTHDEWYRTSVTASPVQAVLSVYQRYGIEPMIWPRSAASNPQVLFAGPPLNLPIVQGGLGHGGRAHAPDEYLVIEGNDRVKGIVDAEKSFVDILYAYANWPE